MKTIIFLFTVILYLSCETKSNSIHTVSIVNNSSRKFDSIIVTGGGTNIKFYNVKVGESITKEYKVLKKFIGDDAFGSIYYMSDSSINYSGFAYNSSPEDVPHLILLTIDRDLRIRDSIVK